MSMRILGEQNVSNGIRTEVTSVWISPRLVARVDAWNSNQGSGRAAASACHVDLATADVELRAFTSRVSGDDFVVVK